MTAATVAFATRTACAVFQPQEILTIAHGSHGAYLINAAYSDRIDWRLQQ
jgi:hypothetical protein